MRWLADDEPEVWAATRRVYGASSFVVSRLTGEYVLDHHSASHWAPLYDVYRNAWIDEWVEQVAPGVPLPRLVWPQEVCGAVSREAAAATGLPEGTPVAAGSIDSWCEVVASGLRGPGEGLLVYGTSMFLIEVHSPARPDARLWTTVGFTPGSTNLAAGVASAGALTAWLRDLAGDVDYDVLYAEAAAAGLGAGGLLALPYFAGERTPLFDPDLRGAILGLTAAHGRGHLFRALMEAAAFAVRHNLETMREAGATIAALRSSGGGAGGALWPRIVSDVTGVAQDVREGPSRAGVGAALLAAIAVGAATLQIRWPQPTVRVEPDPEAARLRRALRVVSASSRRDAPFRPRARSLAAGPLSWHDVIGGRPESGDARRKRDRRVIVTGHSAAQKPGVGRRLAAVAAIAVSLVVLVGTVLVVLDRPLEVARAGRPAARRVVACGRRSRARARRGWCGISSPRRPPSPSWRSRSWETTGCRLAAGSAGAAGCCARACALRARARRALAQAE